MAPTITTAIPLVLKASFVFSGMFGIRLDGIKDQDGQSITVQSVMPLNFTVPAVVMNQRSVNTTCIENCNPTIFNTNNPSFAQIFPNSIKSNNIASNAKSSNEPVTPFPSLLVVQTPLPTIKTTTARTPALGKSCGPGRCSQDEICVSWMKQSSNNRQKNRRESPMMVHECLPNDGILWTKMNPTGARLCEKGKTYSILLNQSRRNCISTSQKSCEIFWKYVCVDEKESPHSCSLKDCPFKGACTEVKHCDLTQLCYVEAICTPGFLIPDKIRESLRKKAGIARL